MRNGMAVLIGASMLSGLMLANPKPSLGAGTHKARPRMASAHVGVIEKSLLGIRMLASYKSVLNMYGQPNRVYRMGESVNLAYSLDANGNQTGGIRGFLDTADSASSARPGGGPGMPGGMPGMPAGMPGMPSGMPGMRPGGGGMPAGMPGMPSGMPGMRPGGGGMPAGMPGMPSGMPGMRPGGGGMPGAGGGGGLNGSANATGEETFAQSGGFIWVYFYPKQELAYEFVFNRDGRTIAIGEHGRYLGQRTSRGIGLGDPARNLYAAYGWPDQTMSQGTGISLNYNRKRHVQFGLLNNKVFNIFVFLNEDLVFQLLGTGQPGGAGGAGGAPGMPGGGGRGRGKDGGGGPGASAE